MKITSKLLIIVVLTVIEVSCTIWAALEISKGADFHRLNVLHLKFNAQFSNQVAELKAGKAILPQDLLITVTKIRQQPVDCLNKVNVVDKFIMTQIDTVHALIICEKDIVDADLAINAINAFDNGMLDRDTFLEGLSLASQNFSDNSANFEQPIDDTVSFIVRSMIPFILTISLLNIFLITYLSRNISRSINMAIDILSQKIPKEDMDKKIEKNITGELYTLLEVARDHLKSSLIEREVNQQLESLVESRTSSLQKVNEELAQFSYRASHDLKAPLTTAKGLAHYIVKDIETGDLQEAKANAMEVESQMERLEELVVGILSLAKADLQDDAEDVIDFESIISEVQTRLSSQFPESKCKFIKEVTVETPVLAQRARILQIVENLLTNAYKYSDQCKEHPFVKIKVFEDVGDFNIVVEDNGLGFPESNRNDIFKMFKRFHPNVSYGSGLGMSIIKKHVDYMKGIITVDSSREGTSLTLEFPRGKTT